MIANKEMDFWTHNYKRHNPANTVNTEADSPLESAINRVLPTSWRNHLDCAILGTPVYLCLLVTIQKYSIFQW